jgi:hypothetical protein
LGIVAEAELSVILKSKNEIASFRFLPLVVDLDDPSHPALPLHL